MLHPFFPSRIQGGQLFDHTTPPEREKEGIRNKTVSDCQLKRDLGNPSLGKNKEKKEKKDVKGEKVNKGAARKVLWTG